MRQGTDNFDLELERELHRVLDPMVAGSIPLRHAPRKTGFVLKFLSSAGAALAAKTVTGVAIAALAVGTAGAATEAVITKSFNPADWGHQISLEVRTVTGQETPPPAGNSSTVASPSAHQGQPPVTSTVTPGLGLPVAVPTVTPVLPKVSPLPLPTPTKVCGPLNNEVGLGC